MNKQKQAFTLVELIVVITILAILGTIAFISLSGYSSQSRDSVRISDIASMKTGLELFQLDAGKYPLPSDETIITYSGAVAWTQGYFGEQTTKNIGKLDKIPTDPLTDKKYVYSTTSTRNEFQLAGVMEGDEISLNTNIVNAAEKIGRLKISGNYNGKLLKVNTGSTSYILAMPSIMSTSGSTVETITTNNLLAYNGYKNIPFQYSGVYNLQGETGLNLVNSSNLIVYQGDLLTLSDTTATGTLARKTLIQKLQLAYSGTTIKNVGEISTILLTDTNDANATESVSTTLVNNNLGGSIISSGSTGTGNSEVTPTIYGNDANSVFLLNSDFDSSANANIGTFNGNTSISNSSKKIGKGSYNFDGNGDYISVPDSTDFDLSSGDNTIDFYVYIKSLSTAAIIGQSYGGNDGNWCIYTYSDGKIGVGKIGVTEIATSPGAVTINQWYHIAVVKEGTSTKIYINGVENANNTTSVWNNSTNNLIIGGFPSSTYANIYLDEVRISKGIARWTSNFSGSLPGSYATDSYTKLLLHGEGNIGNGNNHDLTFNGNINSYSSVGKFDGSYSYDGNGDYTTIPNDSDFQLGSNDFTIDFWVNPSNFSSEQGIVNKEGEWWFSVSTDNKFHAWFTYGTPMWNVKLDSTNTFTANQWYHIAVVRNGSTMKLYINGIEEASSAVSGSSVDYIGSCANKWAIGAGCNGVVFFTGKVDEFRVSKGIARWTSAFTPPSAKYITQ